ncbi:outer membrane protein assembly factor BamD (BamD/ComL family) [Spirosoma oryzae]|uniref:Outer membrane protein assembly factor BamD (BamD/ComL family) n=1 Tax=Spirosoma oryzae TaxID=1469603 RepID=A0A2T0TNP3_9BACT|nr:tetratricopeptide repeat protein [Spirosoma oryzae]PRY47285.1 outer membrane protein assembly factor BamD (BamD/ComL family) [Spirosoma oryzae]
MPIPFPQPDSDGPGPDGLGSSKPGLAGPGSSKPDPTNVGLASLSLTQPNQPRPVGSSANRWLLSLTLGLASLLPATAQRTLSYAEPDYHYRNGLELFERANYAAARYEFRQYLDPRRGNGAQTTFNTADQNAVEAEYYIALTSLYIDEPGAEVLVDRFVKNHSEHPKAGQLYGDLGSYYYTRQDYPKAINFLEKAVAQGGGARQLAYSYQLAVAYYNTQDLQKALPLFNQVKTDPASPDAASASYYAGVINFRNRNYNEAVADFRRIESNPTYQNQVPNWIAQAYYRQRRFDELLAYTEPLLRRNTGSALSEVALFTAEVYYQQNQFAKAIPYYKQYINAAGAKAPGAVRFRYGQSLFRTGAYPDAITQLKTVAGGRDTTAQYAAYTLGISYLQTQNPTYALNAFDQAGRLTFNPSIQEEARFNHAKLQLDQNNGADAVKELTGFLKQYPDSKFESEANELVGEAYFASNNYPAAIAYIEGLKRRTAKINATYQRLTYNQAVSDFNAERYPTAIANFDKSLRYPADAKLQQGAQFWKAESYSAQKQYEQAIPLYASVSKGGDEELATRSLYALGYAYYNQKNYSRAIPYFRDFVSRGGEAAQVADATIRLADAYFATKQYDAALRAYDQAIARNAPDKDYASYQKAVILSYVGRDAEAKAQFEQVQRQYPNSRFVDESLFQTANVDFEKGAYQAAIRGFTRLIQEKPNSTLMPAALLKRAIAYGNIEQYDPAIADYRRILSNYGNSEQAQSALLGIQNTLNDAGRPEEFSQVLGQFKKSNPGSSDVERVQFDNAKNIYFSQKYAQAIQSLTSFIQEYPASPNLSEARYYLGEAYRQTNDPAAALKAYEPVLADRQSDFFVRAATRVADLESKQKNYPRAVRAYRLVMTQANSRPDQVTAQLGLMDTYFAGGKPDSAAVVARDLVSGGNVVAGAQNRAQLMLGKVAFAKNDYATAKTEFDKTIALGSDVNGAEAQYYLGDMLYRQKKYKESVATLLKFNEQFAEFEYWKGKAFILVADNNVAQDELAQAKAVLNSIIENSGDQTIVAEAKQKLAGLETK